MKKTILLIILSFFFLSCNNKSILKEGNSDTYLIEIDGNIRSFILHLPENYTPKKKYSLAIMLHGGGGSGSSMTDYTNKSQHLDFIMVYPNGIGGSWRYNKGFNNYSEDIVFIEKLTKVIKKDYSVDKDRVYLGGISLGGQMTYSCGVYIPENFTAIGVTSTALATSFIKKSNRIKPLSLMHIHAKDDDVFLYSKVGLSALNSIEKWKEINISDSLSVISYPQGGVTSELWNSKETNKITQLITYEDGGHNYLPRSEEFTLDFFYNTPPRENRVSLDIRSQKDFYLINEDIPISLNIKDKESVQEIIYTVNSKSVYTTSTKNPIFKYTPKEQGLYRIGALVKQKSGEIVHSAITQDILVLKPFHTGDYSAKASSVEVYAFQPNMVVDGDLTTRWASGYSDNEEILIDFKNIQTINGVTILWEEAYGKSYFMEYSTDNISWESIMVEKDSEGPDFFDLDSSKVRYIRIRGKKRATTWGYSIFEILIH